MEYRRVGRSGLQISAISLGGWLTYGGYTDNERTFKIMKAAYDCGINFFDCAEVYSAGESEKSMGAAIKHFNWKRNSIVVSTKIYWGKAFADNHINNTGLSRKHIIEGLDQSLERLGLDYVDIVYAHQADRDTPIEETVRAFNHVINQGKALYWGTSSWSASEIAAAWGVANRLGLIGPIVEQPVYNMLEREKVEKEYDHLYEEYGIGTTVWSPLKQGILTGKYNDGIPSDSRFAQNTDKWLVGKKKEFEEGKWEEQLQIVRKLKPIAEKVGITQAQLAYAWVLKNKNVSSALTGASRVEQVYEAVKSVGMVKLITEEVREEIEKALGNKPFLLPRRMMN